MSAVTAEEFSRQSNASFLRGPDVVLTGDFAPTQENVKHLRRSLDQWASSGGPLILGGGLQIHIKTESGWQTLGCHCKPKVGLWARILRWLHA